MACSKSSCEIGEHEERESFFEEHFLYFIIPSGILLAISIIIELIGFNEILSQIIAFTSIILSSYGVAREALEDITHRKVTANILMLVAAIASFIILHGQEGATAILLYAIAERLEEITTERSKRSINELLQLAPNESLLKVNEQYKTVPTDQIKLGDTIGIKPGMKVPLDGVIIKGATYFDESAITGESLPIFKQENDEVYAASINVEGFVDVKVNTTSENTIVAQIANSIQYALKNKSKKERFIERFAKYYTPLILTTSILLIIIPTLIAPAFFSDWFYRGLVLLVISCPCALTLSTPIANIAALTKLARDGILIKGNRFLELADDIQAFAFDKTGTLTEGNLRVFEIEAQLSDEKSLVKIAASLESLSEHPIARAIVNYAVENNIETASVENFEIFKGLGIKGEIDGVVHYVGNQKFLERFELSLENITYESYEDVGIIPILVGTQDSLLGVIKIRDVLRISAPILIDGLKERGKSTVMISGDNQYVCNTIGACLNITKAHGELLPNQKIDYIKNLKEQYKAVAMVGDGINDAPSLALADLGIAIGASATDLTLETADVVILSDNLHKVLTFLDIAKRTNKIIKQNIWFSITVKLVFAILTIIGLMTLWVAVGVGDMGVSLLVMFNGLRILNYKIQFKDMSKDKLSSKAKMLICQSCENQLFIPQHHGRDMIHSGDEMVCWRNILTSDEYIENCEEKFPLNCPKCNDIMVIK